MYLDKIRETIKYLCATFLPVFFLSVVVEISILHSKNFYEFCVLPLSNIFDISLHTVRHVSVLYSKKMIIRVFPRPSKFCNLATANISLLATENVF